MEKDARDSAGVCKQLEKEYLWIASEKRLFGRPGSDYDWTARDPQAAFAEYRQLEQTLQGLSNTLNKKVRNSCKTAQDCPYLSSCMSCLPVTSSKTHKEDLPVCAVISFYLWSFMVLATEPESKRTGCSCLFCRRSPM